MIFQDPMMTLNPVLSIGTQMVETVLAHEKVSPRGTRGHARAIRSAWSASPRRTSASPPIRTSSPAACVSAWRSPSRFCTGPDLIIADEPTTALDVTIQSQILAQIQGLSQELGMALVWISHDLGVVAGLAHRIAVMYAGRIVEIGPTDDVLDRPVHPYTIGLLQSIPANVPRGAPLRAIPGMAPSPLQSPVRLRVPPALRLRHRDLRDGAAARRGRPRRVALLPSSGEEGRMTPLVEAVRVSKRFVRDLDYAEKLARLARMPTSSRRSSMRSIRVDLKIMPGEVVGLVGESGCGKSTLGRILAGIMPQSDGEVLWHGQERRGLARRGSPRGAGSRRR